MISRSHLSKPAVLYLQLSQIILTRIFYVYNARQHIYHTIPYKLPPVTCLSPGPSQGLVYRLSKKFVIKVPYQYPVDAALCREDAEEQLDMSLRSLALFKKEVAFYNLLDKNPHPNLARRIPSKQICGIALERFQSLQIIWKETSKDMHLLWIMQLLYALEWLEDLGYTHGMGI